MLVNFIQLHAIDTIAVARWHLTQSPYVSFNYHRAAIYKGHDLKIKLVIWYGF